ncbi:hypothetical protein ABT373_38740 [Streptomyces sp. NPDC000070]|uniref:hypothetical protein n=1 Tax=Streptomyces sp. NPDC000070 TaxID=3154240 RepID=UPI00332590CF
MPVPAAAATIAAGGEPHEHQGPHGAEGCASDTVVRAAAQSVEEFPLGAMAVVVLVAVSAVLGRPPARHELRRRPRIRTGRVALVRTSRWRI